jgi:peptidoglycan/xylan/chitin deacetylase (PgdA/CDA1 family)
MPGSDFARFTLSDGAIVHATSNEGGKSVSIPFSLSEAYDNYVSEAWRVATRTSQLPPRLLDAFYRAKPLIPRRLQLAARRLLVRRQRAPEFPAWPLDESIVRLLGLYAHSALLVTGRSELPFRWFWPQDRAAALILTHDVETRDGLRLAVELADLEQDLGFRSSFNIGGWYRIDSGIVRELSDRGFEIGLHGVRHDRSLFRSRADFEAQHGALARAAAELHAEGFRSPSTFRVFDWLAELPVAYDASLPHSDPFEPQPGGCCSLWPFFIGPVVELPYTLPQDHTLFTLLKARSISLWLEQAERIERHHGLIHCVSHPDRGYLGDKEKRALYAEFLRAMAERPGLWRALPRDVARWWRLRDQSTDVQAPIARGVARSGERAGDVVFECVPTATTESDLARDLAKRLEDVGAPKEESVRIVPP